LAQDPGRTRRRDQRAARYAGSQSHTRRRAPNHTTVVGADSQRPRAPAAMNSPPSLLEWPSARFASPRRRRVIFRRPVPPAGTSTGRGRGQRCCARAAAEVWRRATTVRTLGPVLPAFRPREHRFSLPPYCPIAHRPAVHPI
jgi:hypothetical protein